MESAERNSNLDADMQEWAYEKAKMVVEDDECSVEEIYHGIALLFYADYITHEQYKNLMKLFKEKHPHYIGEGDEE